MKRSLITHIVCAGLSLSLLELAATAEPALASKAPASVYLGPKYPSDTYLGADTKGAVTFTQAGDDWASGLELLHFFHLNQKTVLLAQASGAMGEDGFGIASGGIGVRRLLADEQTFVGVNAFYDALRHSCDYSYSQIGFGAELSRGQFTLRGNFYLPVGDRNKTFEGTSPFSFQADKGWDAELEVALFKQAHFIDPYIAVGYYSVTGHDKEYAGAKVRGEVRVGKYVNLGAEWRADACGIDQKWRLGIRFEFPIGKAPEKAVPLPVSAVADGKSVRPLENDGKSFKQPLPLEQPVLPPQFLAPIKRTPWPNGISDRDCHCQGDLGDT